MATAPAGSGSSADAGAPAAITPRSPAAEGAAWVPWAPTTEAAGKHFCNMTQPAGDGYRRCGVCAKKISIRRSATEATGNESNVDSHFHVMHPLHVPVAWRTAKSQSAVAALVKTAATSGDKGIGSTGASQASLAAWAAGTDAGSPVPSDASTKASGGAGASPDAHVDVAAAFAVKCAVDGEALSSVASPGTAILMKALGVTVHLPHPRTVTRRLSELMNVTGKHLRGIFSTPDTWWCVTSDAYTSKDHRSLLGISVRGVVQNRMVMIPLDLVDMGNESQSAEFLKGKVLRSLADAGIPRSRVCGFTTDQGAPAKASSHQAVAELGKDFSHPIQVVLCAAHRLNTSLSKAATIPLVQNTLEACLDVANHYRNNADCKAYLDGLAATRHTPLPAAPWYSPTRWDSKDKVLQWALKAVPLLTAQGGAPTELQQARKTLSKVQFDDLRLVVDTHHVVVTDLQARCGETSLSAAGWVAQYNDLLTALDPMRVMPVHKVTQAACRVWHQDLRNRMAPPPWMLAAAVLDRRPTVVSPTLTAERRAAAVNLLKPGVEFLKELAFQLTDVAAAPVPEEEAASEWADVVGAPLTQPVTAVKEEIRMEVAALLKFTLTADTPDEIVIRFYTDPHYAVPEKFRDPPSQPQPAVRHLRRAAPYLFALAPTSCDVERMFSTAGNVLTEKRNRLRSDRARWLVTLNKLAKDPAFVTGVVEPFIAVKRRPGPRAASTVSDSPASSIVVIEDDVVEQAGAGGGASGAPAPLDDDDEGFPAPPYIPHYVDDGAVDDGAGAAADADAESPRSKRRRIALEEEY